MDLDLINKFFRFAPFWVNLAVLLFFLWQIHFIGPTKKFLKKLVFWQKGELPKKLLLGGVLFLLAFNLVYVASKTGFQYWAWKTSGPLSQAFLPPTTPITYFLGYTGFRFWLPVIVNIVFAALFFFAIHFSQKKQKRFFYKGEEYLAALAVLAVGWPALIVYLFLVFLFMLATSFFNTFAKRASYTSFLFFWLPLALFTLLFGNQIINLVGLRVLFISGG